MAKKILLSNNIRSIRAQAKAIPLSLLEAMLKKFELVVKERQEDEIRAQKNIAEHNRKVEAYLQLIKEEGIALTDLLKKENPPAFKKLRQKRAPRPPKYKYYDANGDLRTWTGQGRMPKPIQEALNYQQKSLDDFLI